MNLNHPLPLNREYVKDYLPHRDPMLFIDRVLELSEMSIQTQSIVKADADFFKGHFPDMPIMPGVLIIETVAQTGALLVSLTRGLDSSKFIAFSSVENAKFKAPVLPGQTLTIQVNIDKIRLPFYKFSGRAYVNDKLVASLSFAAAEMEFNNSSDQDRTK